MEKCFEEKGWGEEEGEEEEECSICSTLLLTASSNGCRFNNNIIKKIAE